MERLTKRVGNHYCYGEACKDCVRQENSCNVCGIRTMINRLGELEDKIESGRLVELPREARYKANYTVTVYIAQDGEIWVTNPQRNAR